MEDFITESRTFLGLDGYGGFHLYSTYVLRYRPLLDGRIEIALDHLPPEQRQYVKPIRVSADRFAAWWVKP